MEQVQTPVIPVIGEWIAKHPGTISLGQGVVHFSPPSSVDEAVIRAVRAEPRIHRYGLVRGIDELLEPLATKVANENQTSLLHRSLIVTAGSNMAFLNSVLAIADVDDEIILLGPYYFNHEMAITMLGCRPVIVATDEDCQVNIEAIRNAITAKTRAVVTISPNNPTGAVYSESALRAVNRLCQEHGLFHISDEAYEYFHYEGSEHFSPASITDSAPHTISLYSLSKAYGMAGWRVGYMVIPDTLETAIKKIQDTNLICPPLTSQFAAVGALQAGASWCHEQIRGFSRVREMVLNHLDQLSDRVQVPSANGAFYVLVRVQSDRSDLELVEQLIREFGVAVMPGSTFGIGATEHGRTECSLRIAYGALQPETVDEGMGRVVRGLKQLV